MHFENDNIQRVDISQVYGITQANLIDLIRNHVLAICCYRDSFVLTIPNAYGSLFVLGINDKL